MMAMTTKSSISVKAVLRVRKENRRGRSCEVKSICTIIILHDSIFGESVPLVINLRLHCEAAATTFEIVSLPPPSGTRALLLNQGVGFVGPVTFAGIAMVYNSFGSRKSPVLRDSTRPPENLAEKCWGMSVNYPVGAVAGVGDNVGIP